MATTTPAAYLKFAADHCALLADIFQRRRVNDAELAALIQRHASPDDPSAGHIARQVVDLGLLEPAPDATASYELARVFANLLSVLLHEHRLTSSAVIQGYLNDLEQLAHDLDAALERRDGGRLVRVLRDVDEVLERMRHDSRQNHDGIVAEVEDVKASRQQLTVRERFERVSRLWERYLVPLRELLDTRKAMDAALDASERVLASAADVFAGDTAVLGEVSATRARLIRLRRDVGRDFRESQREITPLYEALRRESAIAQGAGRALEHVRRHGLRGLPLREMLALPVWRIEGLLDDDALRAYLHSIHGYQPQRPTAIPASESCAPVAFIRPATLDAAVRANLPLNDALAWVLCTYPEATLTDILRAYARLHAGTYGPVRFAPTTREYPLADCTLVAHPMEVTPTHAA